MEELLNKAIDFIKAVRDSVPGTELDLLNVPLDDCIDIQLILFHLGVGLALEMGVDKDALIRGLIDQVERIYKPTEETN